MKLSAIFFIELLKHTPPLADNPYIFAGRNAGDHFKDIKKPWGRIRKAAGLHDVRLHDLRRTVGSWLAGSGESLHLIGSLLNHSNPSTTAIYARFGDSTRKRAMQEHGAKLEEVMKAANSS